MYKLNDIVQWPKSKEHKNDMIDNTTSQEEQIAQPEPH